ncbi:basic proline-rich protein-like [Cebus imitator]|uniref:basic proline-rich protein-like n=1 Tax=Cebus imitator TaxID=2715852 RepID=UPI00189B8E4E|nr:basic proline-rich protein-like [Cebus imitator]
MAFSEHFNFLFPPSPLPNSCSAPDKFLKRYSKEVWKPSSSLIHPKRSNQPPSRTCPPLPRPPSRSGSPSSRLKLPADPPRALPGSLEPPPPPPPPPRRSPLLAICGSPLAARSALSSRGPGRAARPGRGCALRLPACARRSHAPCARGPYTATGPHRAARPSPSRWAAARAPRRARPPPGRLTSSPSPLFLPAGLAGRREPTRVDGLPRAQGLRRRVLGLRASRGKQESVRGRGKGKDAEGKGKPRPAAPTRDPLRSGSNNQFIIEAPRARAARPRSNESSPPPLSRARSRSRRLSAPGSRHDAERASERNRLRRSRRRRRHRGRRRLRLPRDVSACAHSPS